MKIDKGLLWKALTMSAVLVMLASCGGGGGGSGTPASPTVPTPVAATASLQATARLDGTTDLSWSSTNATSCALAGSSTATNLSLSGTMNVVPATTDKQSYTLTCSGAGGNGTATAAAPMPTSFAKTCEETTIPKTGYWIGDVVIQNNTWGYDANNAISPINHTQCVSGSIAADGTITAEFDWNFDVTNGIKGSPAIEYGKTANWGELTTANMPVAIQSMSPTLGISYTDTITNTGAGSAYDLLFDLYFSNTTDLRVTTLNIAILPVCIGVCYGTVIDNVVINNVQYQVQYNPSPNNPTYLGQLVFANAGTPQLTGTMTFKPFIDYAIAHGYLTSANYFGNFSIGNEDYAGTATSTFVAKIVQ